MSEVLEDQNETLLLIPDYAIEELEVRLAKLNKRADKLGATHITYEIVSSATKNVKGFAAATPEELEYWPTETTHSVRLIGDPPKLAGWTFLGRLDFSSGSPALVHDVPGTDGIPSDLWERGATCDHCGKARRRTNTYVLRHEDGSMVSVGSNCLKDFLGHDATFAVRSLQWWGSLSDDIDSGNWLGGNYTPRHSVFEVVARAVGVSRAYGWVSRKEAYDGGPQSTADVVAVALSPVNKYDDEIRKETEPTDDDYTFASKAVVWVKSLTEADLKKSSYLHNLRTLCEREHVTYNEFGFVASLYVAYSNAMKWEVERRVKAEAEAKGREAINNEFVGKIKERLDLTVTVDSIMYLQSDWGTTALHRMRDDEGHQYIWFASGSTELKEGETHAIRGTVKKHNEFKGTKQTVLNRVTKVKV